MPLEPITALHNNQTSSTTTAMISIHERGTSVFSLHEKTSVSLHSSTTTTTTTSENKDGPIINETSTRTAKWSNIRSEFRRSEEDFSSHHLRDLSLIVSDPSSIMSNMEVNEEDFDEDDDNNSTILLAIREHGKQMDSWFEDEAGNLEVRHLAGSSYQSEEDEDGLREEMLTLQYSQEKLRQEMEVLDLILSPRISGGAHFFPSSMDEQEGREDGGDNYSDVTDFLEQYEQGLQKYEAMTAAADEIREYPPDSSFHCRTSFLLDDDNGILPSPYILSSCMPREEEMLATIASSTIKSIDVEDEPENDDVARVKYEPFFNLSTPYAMKAVSNFASATEGTPRSEVDSVPSDVQQQQHAEQQQQQDKEQPNDKKPIAIETALSPRYHHTRVPMMMATAGWMDSSTPTTDISDSIMWRPDEELDESILAATWMATLLAGAWLGRVKAEASKVDNPPVTPRIMDDSKATRAGDNHWESILPTNNSLSDPQASVETLKSDAQPGEKQQACSEEGKANGYRLPPICPDGSTTLSSHPQQMTNPLLAAAVWFASSRPADISPQPSEPENLFTRPTDADEAVNDRQRPSCKSTPSSAPFIERNEEEDVVVISEQQGNFPFTLELPQTSSISTRPFHIEAVEVFPSPLRDMMLTPLTEASSDETQDNRFQCCKSAATCGAWAGGGGDEEEPATDDVYCMDRRRSSEHARNENTDECQTDDRVKKSVADDLTDSPSDESGKLNSKASAEGAMTTTSRNESLANQIDFSIAIGGTEPQEQSYTEPPSLGVELILHETSYVQNEEEGEDEEGENISIDSNMERIREQKSVADESYISDHPAVHVEQEGPIEDSASTDSNSSYFDEIDEMILSPRTVSPSDFPILEIPNGNAGSIGRTTTTSANPILKIRRAVSDSDANNRKTTIEGADSFSSRGDESSVDDCGRRRMSRRLGGPEEMIQSSRSRRRIRRKDVLKATESAETEESFETNELLQCNEQLLESIVNFDYATYSALVSDDLIGIDSNGVRMGVRQNFQNHHNTYPAKMGIPKTISLVDPVVRLLSSTAALVTYTRVDEMSGTDQRFEWNETRVWERRQDRQQEDGDYPSWVNCHYHQSKRNDP